MIGYLEGTVRASTLGGIIVQTGGIGYKVALTKETVAHFLAEHIENRPYLSAEDLLSKKCLTSEDSFIPKVDVRAVREAWLG
jgi:hypothetical protein